MSILRTVKNGLRRVSRGARDVDSVVRKLIGALTNYGGEWFSWTGYGLHGANLEELPLSSWRSFSASPRDDIDKNLFELRKRSRDLYMSSAFYSAVLSARRSGVVGRGLHLDANLDTSVLGLNAEAAADYEHKIESAFARWSRNVGRNGETFDELLSDAYFAAILSGDCFVEVDMRSGLPRLSIIEGDLVETPPESDFDKAIRCGVEINRRGRVVAYHCATEFRYNSDGFEVFYYRRPVFMCGMNDPVTGEFIPPSRIGLLHVHTAFERPGQLRGIPLCSRTMGAMKQLDRYICAELDASVVAAKPTVFIEHPAIETAALADVMDEYGAGDPAGGDDGAPAARSPHADVAPPPIELGNGAILDLENGAKAQGFNPGRPNQAFSGFVDAMEAQISAALGLPVEVATKKFSSSYSASRAVLLDADRTYAVDRALLIRQLVRTVYHAWLDAVAGDLGLTGYYDDPIIRSAWRGAEWLGEKLPSIDPTREVDAAIRRVGACMSTLARESQELTGTDINANIRQRGFEDAMMRRYDLLKDQNGVPIGAPNDGREYDDTV